MKNQTCCSMGEIRNDQKRRALETQAVAKKGKAMKRIKWLRKCMVVCSCLSSTLTCLPPAVIQAQQETSQFAEYTDGDRKNLALSAVFSGTGTNLNQLNDGDKTNYWDGGVAPGYFIADLGKVCLIDEIVAYPLKFNDERYYHYEISASSNGLDFETIIVHDDDDPGPASGDSVTFETPVSARYIKVKMTYDSKNPSVHMSEIEIFGTETDDPGSSLKANLASGKPVTGSGRNVSAITDGRIDANGFWDGGPGPNSFTVDLQKACDVSRIVAFPYWKEGGFYRYEIYGSLDGNEYTLIAEKNNDAEQTSEGDTFDLEQEYKARFILVRMTYNSRNPSVHMNEFQVFGTVDEEYVLPDPVSAEDPDNIAKGKPTRCADLSENAAPVTDGSLETAWTPAYVPAYVDIDLMEQYTLDDLYLHFNAAQYKKPDGTVMIQEAFKYSIYGSNDYEHFDLLAAKKTDDPSFVYPDHIPLNKESYRFLRIYLEGHKGMKRSLSEVRVHGSPTGENTDIKRTGSIDEIMSIVPFEQTEYAAEISEDEILENIYGIVDRTVGSQYRSWFDFELGENQADGKDWFDLSMQNGKIHITGNNGISIATGLNHYYKYYANVNISEQARQVSMPEQIVPVEGVIHKETDISVRYAFNYCTIDYTFAFFGEEDYQRENDWLALNGVNVVLDLAGQEAVWIKYLQSLGYSVDEAKDWLTGPGYYAWQFMANMENYGGPVSDAWVTQRLEMARKNQRWKRSLGMQTVMQGYAGMVPTNVTEKQNISILKQGKWCGMDRPDMIRTDGETYDLFADQFYAAQKWALGDGSNYFAVDPFHEGGIRPSDLSDDIISREILSSMLKNNSEAVWLVQGWGSNPTKKLLEGMGDNREKHVMVLDLTAHTGGTHNNTSYENTTLDAPEYEGTPWIWCALTNYGGNAALSGHLGNLIERLHTERTKCTKFKGIGIISEGTYDSPVVYDLLFESVWEEEPIELQSWIRSYVRRRYGTDSESLNQAWDLMLETYYNTWSVAASAFMPTWNNGSKLYAAQPTEMIPFGTVYNYKKTVEALEFFSRYFDQLKDCEAYLFDLSEILRQVVADSSVLEYQNLLNAINSDDIDGFREIRDRFLALFDLEDEVQSTNKDQMVGEWIGKASDWSSSMDDFSKNLLKINAKALLTVWHSADSSLIDYTHRYYSGLTKDVYKKRWSQYLDYVEEWMSGTSCSYQDDGFNLYWDWVLDDKEYGRLPDQSESTMKSLISRVLTVGQKLSKDKVNLCLNKPVEVSYTQVEADGYNWSKENATDGNINSLWSGGPYKDSPWLIVDLEDEYDLDSLCMICAWNYEARYYHYKVYSSLDKENWELIGEKNTDRLETRYGTVFQMDHKRARYLKVVGVYNSHNESFHINELMAYGTIHADKTALKTLINSLQEENLLEEEFTPGSWRLFESAMERSSLLLLEQSVEQSELDQAEDTLRKARESLIRQANKTDLLSEYERSINLIQNDYLDRNWDSFQEAKESAKTLIDDPDALQNDVDAALRNLVKARESLVRKADKNELNLLLETIEATDFSDTVRDENWAAFQSELNHAKEVAENSQADQEAADTAVSSLRDSIAKLNTSSRKELRDLIESFDAIDLNSISHDHAYDTFIEQMNLAKAMAAGNAPIQSDVDTMIQNLRSAHANLNVLDRTLLKAAIDQFDKLNLQQFSAAENAQTAAEKGRKVLTTSLIQSEISTAAMDLNQALLKLRRIPTKASLNSLK